MIERPEDGRLIRFLEELTEATKKNGLALESGLRIPSLMRESAVDASGVTSIVTTPKSSNTFLVLHVVCFIPAGGSGLLVLDDVQMPVGPGTTPMNWYQAISPDAIRLLESTVSGTMALLLMGEQLSRRMMFR